MHLIKRNCYSAFKIFFFLVSFWLVAGCSQKNSETGDSFPEDSLINVEEEDELKEEEVKINSVQQAREFMETSDHRNAYMNGIIPQMLIDAPEYAFKLLRNTHDRFIVVDKYRMKVILFNKYGVEEESYGMACAKNFGTKHKKADSRTPEGFFSVEGIYDSTDWLFTDDNGVTSEKKGQFGPRFIRLKTPVTYQIGIHGTCAPWSIGARTSHGCIRITNENILHLVTLVEPGMPVIVSPGRRDMGVNESEGYFVPSVSTIVGEKAPTAIKVKASVDESEKTDSVATSSETTEPSFKESPESTPTPEQPQQTEALREEGL